MITCNYCDKEATSVFRQGVVREIFCCADHTDTMFLEHTGLIEEDWRQWRIELDQSKSERLGIQNDWRATYDNLSYKEMGEHYSSYVSTYGYQDQYDRKWWDKFFEGLKDEKIYVIELGGHRGGMAARVLKNHENISDWINFDIDRDAVNNPICDDHRYQAIVASSYLWNLSSHIERLKDHRLVFVGAHVLEHIKREQLIKLIDNIIIHCVYVGIEIPLQAESTHVNWHNFDGSHILEIGWGEILRLFRERNFQVEYDGLWNAKMEKVDFAYNPGLSRIANHNRWRENYGDLSFDDQKRYYETIFKNSPHQRQYTIEHVEAPFRNQLRDKYLWVIEFGGYQGELAHQLLLKYDNVKSWTNYEISERVLTHQVCNDPRYTPILITDFIWNKPPPLIYNTFVSSHTIEHITGDDFKKLVDKVIRHCDYVILEIPLPIDMSRGAKTWHNYDGTHIQDLSWNDIVTILFDVGFTKFIHTGLHGWNYFGYKVEAL